MIKAESGSLRAPRTAENRPRAAVWAIRFYERDGFRLLADAQREATLRRYVVSTECQTQGCLKCHQPDECGAVIRRGRTTLRRQRLTEP